MEDDEEEDEGEEPGLNEDAGDYDKEKKEGHEPRLNESTGDYDEDEDEEEELGHKQDQSSPPWEQADNEDEDVQDDRDASHHLDEYFTANVDHVSNGYEGDDFYKPELPGVSHDSFDSASNKIERRISDLFCRLFCAR